MRYRHAEVVVRQNYPQDYASLKSQEQLAEQILRHLPDLGLLFFAVQDRRGHNICPALESAGAHVVAPSWPRGKAQQAHLPRQQQREIRNHLEILVGRWTVDYGEARAFLPEGFRSDDSEQWWMNKRVAELVECWDIGGMGHGLLGRVRDDVTDQEAYRAADEALTELLDLVPVHRESTSWRRLLRIPRNRRKEIKGLRECAAGEAVAR